MRNLVILDCDGTLVDTLEDVALSFNEALTENGFPTYPLATYASVVGGNLETIISKLLPPDEATLEHVEQVKMSYRRIYLESEKPHTLPFPGMPELLERLKQRGYQLAVNTNKGQALTEALLEKLFPTHPFDAIVGYTEDRPSKPDPFGVDMICSQCKSERGDAVYVGDGASDIATAWNAGIPMFLVAWGQGTEEDWRDCRVSKRVQTVPELEQALIEEASSCNRT